MTYAAARNQNGNQNSASKPKADQFNTHYLLSSEAGYPYLLVQTPSGTATW